VEDLYTMLGYMSPYFPFDAESIHNRDPKVGASDPPPNTASPGPYTQSEQLLQDLSLAYCELTSLLVLPTGSEIPSGKGVSMKVHQTNVLAIQVERVAEYVTLALEGQVRILFSVNALLLKILVTR
jgi:pre-rRNA-processing protein IPI1